MATTPPEAPAYTEEELAQQAKDKAALDAALDSAVAALVSNAQAAATASAAVTAILAGIVNEARVYREDGPTLEAFIDKLEAAGGTIAAACAAH